MKLSDFELTDLEIKENDIWEGNVNSQIVGTIIAKRNNYLSVANQIRSHYKLNNSELDFEIKQDLLYLDLVCQELNKALDIIWGWNDAN